ncbi:MAG: hypothetical protein U9P49_02025 [Thermodesulfobacteriota bacterium]|nr:hypothetical protein [Thermodesulfobacteriota bacterium]
MRAVDFVRPTFIHVAPIAVLGSAVFFIFGYTDISLGIVIGVAGSLMNSLMMAYSTLGGLRPVRAFILRFACLGGILALSILISMPAFFAAAAGFFFAHVVFIIDQVRAGDCE